jgi:hypothetical protein
MVRLAASVNEISVGSILALMARSAAYPAPAMKRLTARHASFMYAILKASKPRGDCNSSAVRAANRGPCGYFMRSAMRSPTRASNQKC